VLRDGVLTVRMPGRSGRRAVAGYRSATARRSTDRYRARRRRCADFETRSLRRLVEDEAEQSWFDPTAIQGHLGSMGFGAHVRWRNLGGRLSRC
jgi:transcription elongation GreA/GreB family factor